MTITSPLYSFVQMDALGSNRGLQILPVVDSPDVVFQFKVTVGSESEGNAIMATDYSLLLVNGTASITDNASLVANTVRNYATDSLHFVKYRLSTTEILFYWPHGVDSFHLYIGIGECFKVAVVINSGTSTKMAYSNNFKRTDDNVFTTLLQYSCTEDSYGFIYCVTGGTVPNQSRVSFYLKKIPQFQDEESIYKKSDGSIIYLKSVTNKEYSCITDYLDAPTHEKLKIALSNDNCIIYSDTYSGSIIKNGAYEIDPLDIPGDIDIAQAKFKVFATPYNVRNNNCDNC